MATASGDGPAVCPVPHDQRHAGSPLFDAVKRGAEAPTSSSSDASSSTAAAAAATTSTAPSGGVCPVPHDQRHASPLFDALNTGNEAATERTEPADTPDREVQIADDTSCAAPVHAAADAADPGEVPPESTIPSTGRGNSDDGQAWMNPSPNQLFRALRRKNKAIEAEDAFDMAFVHEAVTVSTWNEVLKYEALHADSCPEPRLARFNGMYGKPTVKSTLMSWLGYPEPFDRHDWIVDRCGKEVRYIIDYYSVAEGEDGEDVSFFIDARPALTPGGIFDRVRLATTRMWNGESWW